MHPFYMDDLKIYAASEFALQNQLEIIKMFSEGIKMEFGIEKCAYLHMRRGVIQDTPSGTLTDVSEFGVLSPEETYNYLGVQQSMTTDKEQRKGKSKITLLDA